MHFGSKGAFASRGATFCGWYSILSSLPDHTGFEAMRQRLAELNPHATRSLAQRLLEAHGRGFWAAQQSVLDHLHNALDKLEDHLEGVNGQASRASQEL